MPSLTPDRALRLVERYRRALRRYDWHARRTWSGGMTTSEKLRRSRDARLDFEIAEAMLQGDPEHERFLRRLRREALEARKRQQRSAG